MSTATMPVAQPKAMPTADRVVLVLLLGFVAALQISIALANILLAATLLGWAGLRIRDREVPSAPPFFIALLAYALLTLIASAFSVAPAESFIDRTPSSTWTVRRLPADRNWTGAEAPNSFTRT